MVCDDAAARDGWWRALAACVAATRALARKRTIGPGYVVKDLDDGATLTEQFADAATTTVAGRVEINQCVGYDIATPSSRRRVDGVEDDAMIQHERAVKF